MYGRREQADALARERRIDRQGDQDRRFAPSPAAHQNDATMVADEFERRDLRGMHRGFRQDDRACAANQPTGACARVDIERPIRKPANGQGTGARDLAASPSPGLGRLSRVQRGLSAWTIAARPCGRRRGRTSARRRVMKSIAVVVMTPDLAARLASRAARSASPKRSSWRPARLFGVESLTLFEFGRPSGDIGLQAGDDPAAMLAVDLGPWRSSR